MSGVDGACGDFAEVGWASEHRVWASGPVRSGGGSLRRRRAAPEAEGRAVLQRDGKRPVSRGLTGSGNDTDSGYSAVLRYSAAGRMSYQEAYRRI